MTVAAETANQREQSLIQEGIKRYIGETGLQSIIMAAQVQAKNEQILALNKALADARALIPPPPPPGAVAPLSAAAPAPKKAAPTAKT
jgi:hypothetical protein